MTTVFLTIDLENYGFNEETFEPNNSKDGKNPQGHAFYLMGTSQDLLGVCSERISLRRASVRFGCCSYRITTSRRSLSPYWTVSNNWSTSTYQIIQSVCIFISVRQIRWFENLPCDTRNSSKIRENVVYIYFCIKKVSRYIIYY